MDGDISLEDFYDQYPRIEEAFQDLLDVSLEPRGKDHLWTVVAGLAPSDGELAVDVGCGEGDDALALARRFGVRVIGVDPVDRHLELATAAARGAGEAADVTFRLGRAEQLPIGDGTADLIWAKESLMYADVDAAFAEFRRVLRPGGRGVVYQVFTGPEMSDAEADAFWREGSAATSLRPEDVERAIAAAGLRLVDRVDYGSEWGEHGQERSGAAGRRLLHAARLLRDPQRYIDAFGEAAYRIMLVDCRWHVYRMIGKLHGAALTFAADPAPS